MLPDIPGAELCCSRTLIHPRALLPLLLFQHETAFSLFCRELPDGETAATAGLAAPREPGRAAAHLAVGAVLPPRKVLAPLAALFPKIHWGSSCGKPQRCVPAARGILQPQDAPSLFRFPPSPGGCMHSPFSPPSQQLYPIPCTHRQLQPHPVASPCTPKPSAHRRRAAAPTSRTPQLLPWS